MYNTQAGRLLTSKPDKLNWSVTAGVALAFKDTPYTAPITPSASQQSHADVVLNLEIKTYLQLD